MTTFTSNQPKCQEGYWTFGEVKALLCMIQGDEIKIKNLGGGVRLPTLALPTPTVLTALRVVYVSRWLLDQC